MSVMPRGSLHVCRAPRYVCMHVKQCAEQTLPPSLSLPSLQAVSIDMSQPGPLHPSWQTQYQPPLPRVHLPLPLHKPGQPSADTGRSGSVTAREVKDACSWLRAGAPPP